MRSGGHFETPNGRGVGGAVVYEKGNDAGVLLPGQYVDLVRRKQTIEGELKLLLAVLEDAIRCYLRSVNAKDRERRPDFVEVRDWFEAGSRRADIFSFDHLCTALGIELFGSPLI